MQTTPYSCALLVLLLLPPVASNAHAKNLVSNSDVWYASTLQRQFPQGISIHGTRYSLDTLPCLPSDITRFSINAGRTNIGLGPAFAIQGSLALGPISPPFEIIDGSKGRKYMLLLQAFLISPDGSVVWEQSGFPKGGAWINADGATVRFMLIDAYRGPTAGFKALILAIGDPILSEHAENRVILGIKELVLQ